jgi:lipid A ethanolaminephosphotransferase
MPYSFAPKMQKEVPMLFWASAGYARRSNLSIDCLRARASRSASHDVLYHTILGAAESRDEAYDSRLDLLAACREPSDRE